MFVPTLSATEPSPGETWASVVVVFNFTPTYEPVKPARAWPSMASQYQMELCFNHLHPILHPCCVQRIYCRISKFFHYLYKLAFYKEVCFLEDQESLQEEKNLGIWTLDAGLWRLNYHERSLAESTIVQVRLNKVEASGFCINRL